MEKIPQKSKMDQMKEHQANRSAKSKYVSHIIMENLKIYLCILIPILVIGFIWIKPGFPKFSTSLLTDGIIVITLFIFSEYLTFDIGIEAGKQDEEYISTKDEFYAAIERIKDRSSLLHIFCRWKVEEEYTSAMRTACQKIGITLEEYDRSYKNTSNRIIEENTSPSRLRAILKIKSLRPIELTPDMLLNDGSESIRGGIKPSADQYIKQHGSVKKFAITAITAVIAVSPVFSFVESPSVGMIAYTFFKLVFLFIRMNRGYTDGLKAYNTVEVKCIRSKIEYLNAYEEFLQNKTYLKFGNRYGDISLYLEDEKGSGKQSAGLVNIQT